MMKLHYKYAMVCSKNPLLSLRRVINNSSLAVKRRDGPDFLLFNFSDTLGFSLGFQYFNSYLAGPTKKSKQSLELFREKSCKELCLFPVFQNYTWVHRILRSGVDCLFILNRNLISQNHSFNF